MVGEVVCGCVMVGEMFVCDCIFMDFGFVVIGIGASQQHHISRLLDENRKYGFGGIWGFDVIDVCLGRAHVLCFWILLGVLLCLLTLCVWNVDIRLGFEDTHQHASAHISIHTLHFPPFSHPISHTANTC